MKAPKKGGYGQKQAIDQNLAQMAGAIPPAMLKQMGGMGALQGMLKQLEVGRGGRSRGASIHGFNCGGFSSESKLFDPSERANPN